MSMESLTERYMRERNSLISGLEAWEKRLRAAAVTIDPNAVVSGRVKTFRSVLGKAYRKPGKVRTWEEFGDLVALKAIFPTAEGVNKFTAWLNAQERWDPRLDEKTAAPDELKYQAKQFDLSAPDVVDSAGSAIKIEVQVRTAASDAWYVVDHRLRYKGLVELPDELRRKLLRLIVLTELFDEEVQAVTERQVEMPEYAAARLYDQLMRLSDSLFEGHVRTSRPEGLLELLVQAYPDEDLDTLSGRIESFVRGREDALIRLIRQHHFGSSSFIESRDWLYYEPEVLMIAERAINRRALLKGAISGSDFEATIVPMINEFRTIM